MDIADPQIAPNSFILGVFFNLFLLCTLTEFDRTYKLIYACTNLYTKAWSDHT